MGHHHHKNRHHKNYHYKNYYPPETYRRGIKINQFWISFILAIASLIATIYFPNNFTFFLELVFWSYFSFNLYIKAFRKIDDISMASDLSTFFMRIIGVGIVFLSIFIYIILTAAFNPFNASKYNNPNLAMMALASSFNTIDPFAAPIFIVCSGLGLMGLFMIFRFNRRRRLVGIWRA